MSPVPGARNRDASPFYQKLIDRVKLPPLDKENYNVSPSIKIKKTLSEKEMESLSAHRNLLLKDRYAKGCKSQQIVGSQVCSSQIFNASQYRGERNKR